ncbi:hypothetical protein ACHMW6_01870 [Pseudoduganella sp. UC29_106]|uniref:hypothetical protein n=1 Tax=Pseudoduganella sp. UC29_106 TaxID=3374553 RepID=UPI0037578884
MRVPLVHGTKFRDAVKVTNKDVEWVEYSEEGHGWGAGEKPHLISGPASRNSWTGISARAPHSKWLALLQRKARHRSFT